MSPAIASTKGPPSSIAIAAGATGGHRHIGLAIGEAFQKAFPDGRVLYISSTHDTQLPIDTEPGWVHERVPSPPFTGQSTARKIHSLRSLFGSTLIARRLLAAHKTDWVIGCGSFASVAVVLAGRSLGLNTLIHEANRVPGRANRLLKPLVDHVLVGIEPDTDIWNPSGHIVVGNPIRSNLAMTASSALPPFQARNEVLVLGGSQGSAFLNEKAPDLLKTLLADRKDLKIWHQAGEHSTREIQDRYASLELNAQVRQFLDQMDLRYSKARFAITTSGASTLEELAAFGLPALLVPLRNSADNHQTHNAQYVAAASGTLWCAETDWNDQTLARSIAPLLNVESEWHRVSLAMKRRWRPDAARDVVAACGTPGEHADASP